MPAKAGLLYQILAVPDRQSPDDEAGSAITHLPHPGMQQ
jgi:hypothetical protein